jgi:hypothetical protein
MNKDHDEKLAEEPANNRDEHTLTSPNDASVLQLTSSPQIRHTPHKKNNHPLTPPKQNRRIETWIEEFAQALGDAFMADVAKALEDAVHVGRKADEAVREGSSAEKIEGSGERAGNGGQ